MFNPLFLLLIAWSLHACQPLTVSADAAVVGPAEPAPAGPLEVVSPQADQQPPAADVPEQQPPQPALDPKVDELLDRLERSAAGLTAFTADITYQKIDAILGRKEIRSGEIIYKLGPDDDDKRFAVLFDTQVVGTRREQRLKHYVFDGRWLAEIDAENKQFIKREIVPPGRELDPLKLGEGPFPLPVGQKKSEVLARFDVVAAQIPQEGLLKGLQNVEGLLLVPKPQTPEAKEFSKVEIFYDRQTLLPVGIHAVGIEGDEKTVKLTEVKRNPELDAQTLKKLDIAEPDPREWRVSVQPWTGNGG